MTYNLIIAPDAVKDIEKAFDYYSRFSRTAIDTFDKELLQVFDILEKNPFFQVRYKKLRAVPFRSLPYLVFFELDDKDKAVYIYSVFNTFLNTDIYPNR